MAMTPEEEIRAIDEVVRRLSSHFPHIDARTIQTAVDREHRDFDGSRIRDFVPLFVERNAAHHLQHRFALEPAGSRA
jgi:hypothetical protein